MKFLSTQEPLFAFRMTGKKSKIIVWITFAVLFLAWPATLYLTLCCRSAFAEDGYRGTSFSGIPFGVRFEEAKKMIASKCKPRLVWKQGKEKRLECNGFIYLDRKCKAGLFFESDKLTHIEVGFGSDKEFYRNIVVPELTRKYGQTEPKFATVYGRTSKYDSQLELIDFSEGITGCYDMRREDFSVSYKLDEQRSF